ncbi:MAG: bifunctional (p)ppGpp synthetase/guanosine-3',5'-bis(diphosphate) 3'-pyrophosphohydrolase [Rickettsiales bacterium]|nr:bifunctional (p)ppGpp synthetase/guanosine-3',5'-bis(diphosphate) 3'-pyrophosphohydrolase [Rickettsiales bacterium]
MVMDGSEFLEIVERNIKIQDEQLLLKAYDFSKKAHKGQLRDSGDEYFIHPVGVAILISELKLDEASVIAGLLHDTVEDTKITLKRIEKEFSQEVAYLVDGLTKINNAKFQSRTEKNAENFRKLILSTSKDLRILIIKLVDRLNNMSTLSGIFDKERRNRIASDTLMIYVPLAERIGMYKLKLELEDLCFEELFAEERKEILQKIKDFKKNQKILLDDIIKKLTAQLNIDGKINCRITGREKRPYSIWKKMQKKSVSFEKLFDIFAFRVIVDNIEDCYKALGFINSNYVMVPDTFKDYISRPKANGYQSLHIVIVGPKYVKMEIQIRTDEMNRVAEYGAASHWMYKQNITSKKNLEQYNFIKNLVQSIENNEYDAEKFEDLKYEIHEDEVFCYTPKGDVINLPTGSTGIDFAYAIHRDIGNMCSGIKINGALTQFKTKLQNADEVEVLTSKKIQVNEDWLNFVKTSKARSEIKSYIRSLKLAELERIGREDINLLAQEFGITVCDTLIQKNMKKFNQGKTVGEIYCLIAEGKIKKKDFLKILFPNLEKYKFDEKRFNEKIPLKIKMGEKASKSGIRGFDKNIAYKYAKCCYPIPPDDIVGVINSGTGITVHKKHCKLLKTIKNDRIIELEWDKEIQANYVAKLSISIESKSGLLAKVVNLCAEKKINILSVNTSNDSEFYQEIELKIEIKNEEELENFKASLRSIKGIMDIK